MCEKFIGPGVGDLAQGLGGNVKEAARQGEGLFNTIIPGVFGVVLSFQSHDHLEEIQLHPVCKEERKIEVCVS